VQQPAFTLPSFAKINWNLQVRGKRPDGYHEVRTVLQTVSLHDTILFELRDDEDLVIHCSTPGVPTDDSNLISVAARRLREQYSNKSGANIWLEKQIPAQGGLGGASSNAAVALVGLAHLWGLNATINDLMKIGSGIGADVPFFFRGGRALGTGIGTDISELPDAQHESLLIVTPNASVSTREAYQRFGATREASLTRDGSASILSISREMSKIRDSDLCTADEELHNDFEAVIFDIRPEIERAKRALLQAGARAALLAGSGSSVFGIFADRNEQERAHNDIQKEAGWRVFSCDTLSRADYVRAFCIGGTQFLRSS
jgi:4-diphosphocytidyl-2-C-methyl-D-erythritol kinase